MQTKARIGGISMLIICTILAKGWINDLADGFACIFKELYPQIDEFDNVSPKFASKGSHKQWPPYTYRPKQI